MATQHVSIWRDEYTDLSHVYKRAPSADPTGVITSNGTDLIINTLGTGSAGANYTSNVYFYEMRASTNVDIYQTSNNYSSVQIYGGTATVGGSGETAQARMQSFTAVSTNVYGASFYLVKSGTPTDDIKVSLCADSAGTTVLATKTIPSANLTTAASNSFIFGDTALTVGTMYYLVIERTGARDNTNYWSAQCDSSASQYAGGGIWTRTDGTWTASGTAIDFVFRVYGHDTFDMSGGQELLWEVNSAASTINSGTLMFPTMDIFDKVNGTYALTYSSGLNFTAAKTFWRVAFPAGKLTVYSSGNGTTWATEYTGTTTFTTNQLKSVSPEFGMTSSSGSVVALKYWSYGAQQTVATQGIKYWNGTAWAAKPVKYWDGTAWVQKPMKHWDGSQWVTPTY